MMENEKIAKVLSVIIAVAGIAVIFGWIFDIPIIKSISPNWATMKPVAAFSFLLSGIIIYSIASLNQEETLIDKAVILMISSIVILIMGTLLISNLLGIRSHFMHLFYLYS